MSTHGFLRVAAACPELRVADADFNADRTLELLTRAEAKGVSPAANAVSREVRVGGLAAPFGTDLLFPCGTVPDFVLGVEVCEDLWTPVPPSSLQALAGATVLANLSASNEAIGKSGYRKQLI